MKLTKEDKQALKEIVTYYPKDLKQIQWAIDDMKYYKLEDEKEVRVSEQYVLSNMDRHDWLDGCNRAAFHWDCIRHTRDGVSIYFDASSMFKK